MLSDCLKRLTIVLSICAFYTPPIFAQEKNCSDKKVCHEIKNCPQKNYVVITFINLTGDKVTLKQKPTDHGKTIKHKCKGCICIRKNTRSVYILEVTSLTSTRNNYCIFNTNKSTSVKIEKNTLGLGYTCKIPD